MDFLLCVEVAGRFFAIDDGFVPTPHFRALVVGRFEGVDSLLSICDELSVQICLVVFSVYVLSESFDCGVS